MRRHDRELAEAAKTLRVPPERVADEVAELRARVRELERAERRGATEQAVDVDQLAAAAVERDGARVLVQRRCEATDGKALLEIADRLKNKLGDAAIVLAPHRRGPGRPGGQRGPALVQRGVRRARSSGGGRRGGRRRRRPGHAGPRRRARSGRAAGGDRGGARPRLSPPSACERARGSDAAARQLVRSCACLRSITAGRDAGVPSLTRPACSHPRSNRSARRRHGAAWRACARWCASSRSSGWSWGCRFRCRGATRRRPPRRGASRPAWRAAAGAGRAL